MDNGTEYQYKSIMNEKISLFCLPFISLLMFSAGVYLIYFADHYSLWIAIFTWFISFAAIVASYYILKLFFHTLSNQTVTYILNDKEIIRKSLFQCEKISKEKVKDIIIQPDFVYQYQSLKIVFLTSGNNPGLTVICGCLPENGLDFLLKIEESFKENFDIKITGFLYHTKELNNNFRNVFSIADRFLIIKDGSGKLQKKYPINDIETIEWIPAPVSAIESGAQRFDSLLIKFKDNSSEEIIGNKTDSVVFAYLLQKLSGVKQNLVKVDEKSVSAVLNKQITKSAFFYESFLVGFIVSGILYLIFFWVDKQYWITKENGLSIPGTVIEKKKEFLDNILVTKYRYNSDWHIRDFAVKNEVYERIKVNDIIRIKVSARWPWINYAEIQDLDIWRWPFYLHILILSIAVISFSGAYYFHAKKNRLINQRNWQK